ncbi:hypothetical protein GCM10008020_40590 [Massilia psychrophila]|nr:hypothetical protein GCM10008020_40590 [Massilia psychrophila]
MAAVIGYKKIECHIVKGGLCQYGIDTRDRLLPAIEASEDHRDRRPRINAGTLSGLHHGTRISWVSVPVNEGTGAIRTVIRVKRDCAFDEIATHQLFLNRRAMTGFDETTVSCLQIPR